MRSNAWQRILLSKLWHRCKKYIKKIMQTSNAYYNQALSRAGVRDLSGAVESLKKSLRFNKKNIQARKPVRTGIF